MELEFGLRTYVMGILNLTPDSFSGDGIYNDPGRAIEQAENMIAEGADIIDVGGESTRPGADPVGIAEEIKRVIPVVKELAKRTKVTLSIDTRKSEVALRALDSGASIINDITGLDQDSNMAPLVARYNAKVVIMHIRGTPQTMQQDPVYTDVIKEIIERLRYLVGRAEECGVKKENIIIDPGIGFGKTLEHNLEILHRLADFKVLRKPMLIGTSRKSFIGNLLGAEPTERIFGTAASVAAAIKNGADIIRVHDVREMGQVAKVADAIVRRGATINA